jgi:hypothetical protein
MADTSTGLGITLAVSTDTVDVENHVYNPLQTLDAQFLKGTDLSSASSLNVGNANAGNYFHVTGTTGITAITTRNAGNVICLRFAGVVTLTHNSTSLILANGTSRTTAANDIMYFVSEGSGNWRCISSFPIRAEDIAALEVTGPKIAAESIDSDHYVDASIDNAHLSDNAVGLAEMAHGTQGGLIYYSGSGVPTELSASTANYPLVTNGAGANPAYEQLSGTGIAAEAIDSDHFVDGGIDTAHIGDNQITLAKQAHGTQGSIQFYGASGAPSELAAGTSGFFLKTQGGSANPVWAAGGGGKIDQVSFTAGATGATTSTSYADVSGGEIAITTDKGGLIVWYFLSGYNNTLSANNYVALQLDSTTEVAESRVTQHASNQDYVYSGFYRWTGVSDAAHELNIRMKVGSGTLTLRGGAILVMEFDD